MTATNPLGRTPSFNNSSIPDSSPPLKRIPTRLPSFSGLDDDDFFASSFSPFSDQIQPAIQPDSDGTMKKSFQFIGEVIYFPFMLIGKVCTSLFSFGKRVFSVLFCLQSKGPKVVNSKPTNNGNIKRSSSVNSIFGFVGKDEKKRLELMAEQQNILHSTSNEYEQKIKDLKERITAMESSVFNYHAHLRHRENKIGHMTAIKDQQKLEKRDVEELKNWFFKTIDDKDRTEISTHVAKPMAKRRDLIFRFFTSHKWLSTNDYIRYLKYLPSNMIYKGCYCDMLIPFYLKWLEATKLQYMKKQSENVKQIEQKLKAAKKELDDYQSEAFEGFTGTCKSLKKQK